MTAPFRFAALFAALSLLAGCESAADRALEKSPDFKAGYSDGCDSGQGANMRDSGMVRDDAAYRGNKAYHAGWSSGFSACHANQSGGAMPPPAGQGPIPDPTGRPF